MIDREIIDVIMVVFKVDRGYVSEFGWGMDCDVEEWGVVARVFVRIFDMWGSARGVCELVAVPNSAGRQDAAAIRRANLQTEL
jgi:hypothetical protein